MDEKEQEELVKKIKKADEPSRIFSLKKMRSYFFKNEGVSSGTGISLLAEYFVLEYPYWLNILYWNMLAD
jgi:hypothetical protein